MNRVYRNALGATLAIILASAPLARAQQDQAHQNQSRQDTAHEDAHAAPMGGQSHMSGPGSAHLETNAPDHMAGMAPAHQAMGMQDSHPASGGWRHGDRYSGTRHVVSDYGHYHLRRPPAGYEWVRSGNQYVLIAVTSGIIASVLAASH